MVHRIDRHYKRCDNTNIAVYIMWKGEKTPVCAKHWNMIARSNREW